MNVAAFVFSHFIFSAWALRAATEDIAPIGKHYPIFIFEKNEHPENILVTYVKLDAQGKLLADPADPARPLVGFYWLMNRHKYKPVHPLILSGIRERLKFLSEAEDRRSFKMRLGDLKELKQDLKSAEISVSVSGSSEHPEVEATVTLGPSDHSQIIQLEKIYSDARKTFLPPFRKIKSVTLTGKAVASGENISRTYSAR